MNKHYVTDEEINVIKYNAYMRVLKAVLDDPFASCINKNDIIRMRSDYTSLKQFKTTNNSTLYTIHDIESNSSVGVRMCFEHSYKNHEINFNENVLQYVTFSTTMRLHEIIYVHSTPELMLLKLAFYEKCARFLIKVKEASGMIEPICVLVALVDDMS